MLSPDTLMTINTITGTLTALLLVPYIAKKPLLHQIFSIGCVYLFFLALQMMRESLAWRGLTSIWVGATNALIPIAFGYAVAWLIRRGFIKR
jgi:hypothetical protein